MQGLTRRAIKPGDTPLLMVRYQPNRIDSVPETIVVHTTTKERDSRFAALAGWVTARTLTPEVVDLVLSDDSREPPALDDEFSKMLTQAHERAPEGSQTQEAEVSSLGISDQPKS